MKVERKAKQYATALLEVSRSINPVDEVHSSLGVLKELYKKEATFRIFFLSRRLNSDQKIEIIESILGDSCHSLIITLFAILSDNREQNLLLDIAEAYEVLRTDELQILGATIFTAESLSEDDYNSIRESLAKSTGKKVEIISEVNPDLVGGLKLRLGNLFIDGSIRGRLDSLKRELTIT